MAPEAGAARSERGGRKVLRAKLSLKPKRVVSRRGGEKQPKPKGELGRFRMQRAAGRGVCLQAARHGDRGQVRWGRDLAGARMLSRALFHHQVHAHRETPVGSLNRAGMCSPMT